MNLSNQPKNQFLIFLKSFGIGIYAFIVLMAVCGVLIMLFSDFKIEIFKSWLESRSGIILSTTIQFITLFILPAILYNSFLKQNFISTFMLDTKSSFYKYLLGLIIAICMFPLLITLESYIEKIPFSSELLAKAESQKKALEKYLTLLVENSSIFDFLQAFLLISVLAGLAEELFFRGLLLPILSNHTHFIVFGILFSLSILSILEINIINISIIGMMSILVSFLFKNVGKIHRQYLALFLSSVIFSVMHFNIFNFIPILIAGFIFGFIFLKTKDLKINILMHSFFNGIQLILNYLYQIDIIKFNIEKDAHFSGTTLAIFFIILISSIYILTKQNEYISDPS